MISEVYVNFMHAYGIAATIYHELLHNKFRLSVNIHNLAGNFMTATAPYSLGGPSKEDQEQMCKALFQERARQFQGGF